MVLSCFPSCFFINVRMSTLSWAPSRAQLWHTQISLPLVAHLMAPQAAQVPCAKHRGALGIWLLLKVPCSPPGLLRQVVAERSALTELGNRPLSGR